MVINLPLLLFSGYTSQSPSNVGNADILCLALNTLPPFTFSLHFPSCLFPSLLHVHFSWPVPSFICPRMWNVTWVYLWDTRWPHGCGCGVCRNRVVNMQWVIHGLETGRAVVWLVSEHHAHLFFMESFVAWTPSGELFTMKCTVITERWIVLPGDWCYLTKLCKALYSQKCEKGGGTWPPAVL